MWLLRFDVIYHLIGDLRAELGDRMPPVEVEDVVGRLVLLLLIGKQPIFLCPGPQWYSSSKSLRKGRRLQLLAVG